MRPCEQTLSGRQNVNICVAEGCGGQRTYRDCEKLMDKERFSGQDSESNRFSGPDLEAERISGQKAKRFSGLKRFFGGVDWELVVSLTGASLLALLIAGVMGMFLFFAFSESPIVMSAILLTVLVAFIIAFTAVKKGWIQ